MITVEQIKAARALLNWNQEELAHASGISLPAVRNIERRSNKPRVETMEALENAIHHAGIDFIDEVGVKLRGNEFKVQIFEGKDSLYRLLGDIFDTLVSSKEELLVAGVSEEEHQKEGGDKFLKLIRKRSEQGIPCKLLALEGDTNLIDPESPMREYRWVSEEIFSLVPYYIYGDKYAIVLWGEPQRVMLIENRAIAETYRRQFYAIWDKATPTHG